MRLLYVIDSLAPGGAETSLAAMAPSLVAQGIDLHVLTLGRRIDLRPALQQAGAVVHTRDQPTGRVGNVHFVRQVARTLKPGLIHTTLFEADVAGRIAARILRIPSSTSLVNDSYARSHYAETNRAKLHAARMLDAATARTTAHFHSITSAIADSVAPRLRIPRERIEIIPRGREPERFPFRPADRRAATRAKLGISPETPVILAIGRLEPQKGLHHLLGAIPRISRRYPGVVTLVAGKEGRSAADLRRRAGDLHADVRFLGHRTDIADLLAAADVFCFPSEREGFGGVLIEALAVGTPIVASAIPTSVELLSRHATCLGLLADLEQQGQLADALDQALTERDAALSRARQGRAEFDRHYSADTVSRKMSTFFRTSAGEIQPDAPQNGAGDHAASFGGT